MSTPAAMSTSKFDDLRIFTTEPRISFTSVENPGAGDPPGTESRSELFVVIAYLSLLSVVGTGGNSIVMYVFSSKRDQLISTIFILVLAIVDFSTCLVVIPYTVFMEYHDFHIRNDAVCKVYMFLVTSNVPFSSLIMVAIAIDRYLSICHPLANLIDPTRAKVIIVALAVFATVQGVCVSLQFGVYKLESVAGTGNVSTASDEEEKEGNSSESRRLVNTGFCGETDMVVSEEFQWYYQKLHAAIYPACVFAVMVLYSLIYRSVLTRRSLRWSQKSRHLAHVQSLTTAVVRPGLLAESPLVACHDRPDVIPSSGSTKVPETEKTRTPKRKSGSRRVFRSSGLLRRAGRMDAFRMANIRTAAMLFVVALVFIVTFMPAFFMAMKILPYNIVVFYMYFANNVANPVIYSFMNQNFRSKLEQLFCRTRR